LDKTKWNRRSNRSFNEKLQPSESIPHSFRFPRFGVPFHPELKSRPFEPHPPFSSFIEAAVEQNRRV
jgi:CTP synthase